MKQDCRDRTADGTVGSILYEPQEEAMTALTPRRIQHYGWRPDTPDLRDRAVKVVAPVRLSALPPSVDLSTHAAMPPVYDQGQLGSCTANAIGGAFE